MAKAKIPAGITPEIFIEVRTQLLKVLKDLEGMKGAWVTTRLNETGRKDPSPVFVGWVEHKDLITKRVQRNEPDPGLFRFGDDHYSKIYEECLANPGSVRRRDWNVDKPELTGKTLDIKAGVMHRRSIAVKANGGYVGTLNAGFFADPGDKADGVMTRWAQNSGSELVKYLLGHFLF
jgi:hypothetical protein